jgi:hypothetical protein
MPGGRIGTTHPALQGFIFGEEWRMAAICCAGHCFNNRSGWAELKSLIRRS